MRFRLFIISLILCFAMPAVSYAHGGRLDKNGGHNKTADGTYHYHQGSDRSVEYSAPLTQESIPSVVSDIKEAEVYRYVTSRQEFIDYVTEQAEALKPTVKVIIANYSDEEYSVDFTEFLPIQKGERSGFQRGSEAEVTYNFTYTQAERIIHYLSGGNISLDSKETETLSELQHVFYEIDKNAATVFEKQLAIHDYLLTNVEYDNGSIISDDSFTPYGAMVKGLAVCQGYTEAARILLTMAGIENGTLAGTAGGVSHMWNVVKLDDGKYYHMDVTWDDERILDDGTNVISRAFLNLTDSQIDLSHDWDYDGQIKQFGEGCTSSEYNYLKRSGMSVASNEEYMKLVAEKYQSGERFIEVLFEGMDVGQADIEGALKAAGSSGYTGFFIEDANVLCLRFS